MARKPALRLAAVQASHALDPANDGPEAVAAANLAQGELGLAAAALLPALDAAGADGSTPNRLAAALLRAYGARQAEAAVAQIAPPAETEMAAAVARLTRLAREQESHIARLQSLLEGLV